MCGKETEAPAANTVGGPSPRPQTPSSLRTSPLNCLYPPSDKPDFWDIMSKFFNCFTPKKKKRWGDISISVKSSTGNEADVFTAPEDRIQTCCLNVEDRSRVLFLIHGITGAQGHSLGERNVALEPSNLGLRHPYAQSHDLRQVH